MSSISIAGDSSGSITLAAPSVAGTNTATLPAATGTVMVSGNMPAFSAYQSGTQTMPTATFTKVIISTKEFDTNNYYDATTNYRFTPLVAGYYQVTGAAFFNGASINFVSIYKNGSELRRGTETTVSYTSTVSALFYMNGSTDYVELYAYAGVGSSIASTQSTTYFQAVMVRN